MKLKLKTVIIITTMLYFMIYLFSLNIHNELFTTISKPIASFLALFAMIKFAHISENQNKTKRTVVLALLLWFFVDLLAMIGEAVSILYHYEVYNIYKFELFLYAGVRVAIFISVIQLYYYLTKNSNRFQIVSDIFTIALCATTMAWLIFFDGEIDEIRGENFVLLFHSDPKALFSLFYICISLWILGVYLIAWFHFQKIEMTIGQRMVMLGIAGVSVIDLIIALHNSLIGSNITDVFYKVCIILVCLGSVFSDKYPRTLLLDQEANQAVKQNGTWINAAYLLFYPFCTVLIIGFRFSVFCYFPVIAYYISACLYVRQIAITDSLLASEKTNNERLKLYSMVLEQAPLSVVITDTEGKIDYVNPYFTTVTGYTKEEVIGKNPSVLKSDKTAHHLFDELWDNLRHGLSWEGEFINRNKYGEEYEEKVTIAPIKSENDKITHYVAIKENITETKKMKYQINNQSYFTTQLLDTIPGSIFIVSDDDVFMGINKGYETTYKIDREEVIGRSMRDLSWLTEDRYQKYLQKKENVLLNLVPDIEQISRVMPDGRNLTVLYSLSAYYRSDGSLGGFLGIMTDVSELKEKERDLKIALNQANTATEAKTAFLANMSHEIRTPMNAIIGMSYLALKTELDARQRDYVMKIHAAATALLGIVNDILDFSKIESGKMELEQVEFDIDSVVTNSIGLLVQKANEKNLEFLYHAPVEMPHQLIGDPLRLGQIITNLVSNAVKFTEKGEIVIDVIEIDRKGKRICLKFSVKDTGIGISESNLERLFEAFTQSDTSTTREYGGTGLGLTICQRLVGMMGGQIWVESEYGVGSNFMFTVWFNYEETKSEVSLIAKNFQNLKVLIADDNSASREIFLEYLQAMGFQAEAVSSGEDAILLLTENDKIDPYQIAFIDWKMPGLDGIQTIEKISTSNVLLNPPLAVLVTAYDKDEMMKSATGLKVDGFLAKPISQSTLYDTIVKLFANVSKTSGKDLIQEELNYRIAGLRILIAEDNEINQQIAMELLSGQGVIVEIANNGLEALNRIEQKQQDEPYDMVLMDLQMPIMDGFEATKKIRMHDSNIPIIAMTARTMAEEKEKCYSIGMNDHIAKPIDPHMLYTTIQKWIRADKGDKLTSAYDTQKKNIDTDGELLIHGIDTKAGLIRVANNMTLYHQLLQSFARNHVIVPEQIRQSIEIKNYENVGKLSHLLRGVAGNIGAEEVRSISESLERLAETSRNIEEMIVLVGQLEQVMSDIVKLITEKIPDEEEMVPEIELNEKDIQKMTVKLMNLLKEGDSEAIEYFHSLRTVFWKLYEKKTVDNIENNILNYEFEEAKNILEELLN